MNLYTQQNFTVVRQISNHLDTDTNYVRAVIRNAYTDAIIATLNLTDRGSQRFSKNWQVPADPVGEGFYISIVTSVYTDSGYTTKNASYGDEENTYLVQDRLNTLGGRGGSNVDYIRLRKIVEEVVRQEIDKTEKQEAKDYTDMLKSISKTISQIDIPKPEKIEFGIFDNPSEKILSYKHRWHVVLLGELADDIQSFNSRKYRMP